MKHPDWAAAYILVDWNKRGRKAVQRIQEEMKNHEEFVEAASDFEHEAEANVYIRNSEREVVMAIDEAIKRFEVYLAALKDARDGTA